jgi:hypothetical protein
MHACDFFDVRLLTKSLIRQTKASKNTSNGESEHKKNGNKIGFILSAEVAPFVVIMQQLSIVKFQRLPGVGQHSAMDAADTASKSHRPARLVSICVRYCSIPCGESMAGRVHRLPAAVRHSRPVAAAAARARRSANNN